MTTNIYLARLLATERQNDLLRQAERHRMVLATRPPRAPWRDRILQRVLATRRVREDTCLVA